jgi:hypothetical protein
MPLCRKDRDRNTGIATNGASSPADSETRKLPSDISAASNSRNLAIRKKISSTVIGRQVRSMPSGRTLPSTSGLVLS